MLDSSSPLVINASPRISFKSFLIVIAAELIVVLAISTHAPKDHFVNYSIYRVTSPFAQYEFSFSDLANYSRVWLSIFAIREMSQVRTFAKVSFASNRLRRPLDLFLHCPRRHFTCGSADCLSLPLSGDDHLTVAVNLTFAPTDISAIAFEWSTNNPQSPLLRRLAHRSFAGFAVICLVVLLLRFTPRFEQLCTAANSVLLIVAAHPAWLASRVAEYAMVGVVRCFLLYMLSFIANKHRSWVTQLAMFLVVVSFAFDLLHKSVVVTFHLFVLCVCGSAVAAMSLSAEDKFAFGMYTTLLGVSFAATLIGTDAAVIEPQFDHLVETWVAQFGMHSIVLSVLVYFHQAAGGASGDGDKLGGRETSSDVDIIIA
jgi:hypothetical protein